jgi:hypothetical protein
MKSIFNVSETVFSFINRMMEKSEIHFIPTSDGPTSLQRKKKVAITPGKLRQVTPTGDETHCF